MFVPGGLARRVLPYLLVFLAAAAAVTLLLRPWQVPGEWLFVRGGDEGWQHAMVQVFAQAGPLGGTDHLAWPIGISGWTLPQLGLLAGTVSWVLTGLIGIPAVHTVFAVLALGSGLVAAANLYLFRGVMGGRLPFLSGSVALVIALIPLGHAEPINLALWFLVPLTLSFLFRWAASGGRHRQGLLIGLALAALVSPLWWVAMLAVLLPVMLIGPLAHRRWPEFRAVLVASAILWGSLGAQAVLTWLHKGPSSETDRQNWHVTWGSGNLADLLGGTRSQQSVLPNADQMTFGVNQIGTFASLVAFLGFVWLLTLPAPGPSPGRLLRVDAAIVSLLFFLVGGLGSLTILLATVLGWVTPVRSLRFFALVLALAFTAEVLAAAARRFRVRSGGGGRSRVPVLAGVGVLAAGLLLGMADQASLPAPTPYTTGPGPAAGAAGFLQSSLDPCPVAQLPQDQMIGTRVGGSREALSPYLLLPEFYWSHGSYEPGQQSDQNPLAALGTRLDDAAVEQLAGAGFCAILFDRTTAEAAMRQGIEIEGRDLGLDRDPDYQDDSYAVYLLGTGSR